MVIIIKNKVNPLRKKEKITKKILLIIKIFLIATTAIFPMFMNLMSGQVDFLCPKPQHCPGPVMSAVGVGYHLALVHHHDIEIFMVV